VGEGGPLVDVALVGDLAGVQAWWIGEQQEPFNAGAGSSRRVERLLLLTDPPRLDAGEITDKGYINQRATLTHRAELIPVLYAAEPPSDIITPASEK